ncbi:unnamed protein product [Trichobilharzia regenti]|nr:unnamed protein product [Trichobilharzia regenti]
MMEVELGKVLGKYTEVSKVLLNKGYQELDYLEDWKVERLCFRMIRKLNTVCLESFLWCNENVVCLLDVLSNYNLQKTSVEKILDKSLSKIISWNKDKLPEIIQSILLYAFPANIEFVFLRLLSLLYNDKEICSTSAYEAIRGQLMMKMFSLVKDNEDFGGVVFETIKSLSKSRIESEFFFTILMTLLPIRNTQAEAIELLTSSILRAFSDSHLVLESSFLRAICQLSDDPKEIIIKLSEKW